MISQIIISGCSSNRSYFLDERITGWSSAICVSHKARLGYQNSPFRPQNQSEKNSTGFEKPDHGLHMLHWYSAPFFAERIKLKISVSAENPEYFQTSLWIGEAYGKQGAYVASQQFSQPYFLLRQCVTHTSHIPVPGRREVSMSKHLLTLHVAFLINHHLLYHVFFPSGWVSGVVLNSYSTLISNWWLLVVGKSGYFVTIY